MPIQRYQVGRPYVRRSRMRISAKALETSEGVAALAESIRATSSSATLEGRVANALQWARTELDRAGAAIRPADPAWQKENERRSPEWYAYEIADTWRQLCGARARGDIDLAIQLALELGLLATEAKFVAYKMSIARAGGITERGGIKRQHEKWQKAAEAIWNRDRSKSISAVAQEIDPGRWKTVSRVISPLKPKKI